MNENQALSSNAQRFDRSAALGFAGNRLIRASDERSNEALEAALAHPGAGLFLESEGRWLCDVTGARPNPLLAPARAQELRDSQAELVLIGHHVSGAPRLAGRAVKGAFEENGMLAAIDLRSLGMQACLDPDTEGQLAQSAHLLNWHARSGFCARCGGATVSENAGYRRRCTACGDMIFPRTDPVSIMLVHDGQGRCILGRQPQFAPGMWSCLAGFIEPGETLEAAVRRETLEEAGIAVGRVAYHASQPWPFPGNLMIGCIAEALGHDIDFDRNELEDCRWFAREEVAAMLGERHPAGLTAPRPFAIAHHLIKAFVTGEV